MKAERAADGTRHVECESIRNALVRKCNTVFFFEQFAVTNADRFVFVFFVNINDCVIAQGVEKFF